MTDGASALGRTALPNGYDALNRYTRIIVDEALTRGIEVRIGDPALGELTLRLGDRKIATFESLSELTSAVAVKRCDDKVLTRRMFQEAGLAVPSGRLATFDDEDVAFLRAEGDLVVKPVHGEQGWGITVGVTDQAALESAVAAAQAVHADVLLERRHDGEDLRVVVIDGDVVAAAVRRPPTIEGTGTDTVAELFDGLAQRRFEATHGAVRLVLDAPTLATLAESGCTPESVPAAGQVLVVRRTANVHTGGTIEDVTARLDPVLASVALRAAEAIDAPVLGIDLIVDAVDASGYVLIEANEQPGLANHEPQPTAERFIDLLFPSTRSLDRGGQRTETD